MADQPLTVVGVVALPFKGVAASVVATDIWVPSRVLPVRQLFGQLREDVTLEQANAEMRTRDADRGGATGGRGLEVDRGLSTSLSPGVYAVIVAALVVGALVASSNSASPNRVWSGSDSRL